MRIISLLASATEIVCALGAGDSLVGRSHECDNPPWVKSLPRCSEPAFDISMPSGAIDAEVRRRLRAGEPLYRIETDRIRELTPDLIIAQSHCDVCAVTPGDVARSGCEMPTARVLGLAAGAVEGIFESIGIIGRAIGKEQVGRALIESERARLETVRARAGKMRRPAVLMLEWANPLFAMGNWGPELVEIANGELLLGNRNQHSGVITGEQVASADPEFLIVAPCGFSLERACQELMVLQAQSWWSGLRAVRSGKVAFADGNLFFNRSGMTISRTAEIIAEILHGEVFGTPTAGVHWHWIEQARNEPVSAAGQPGGKVGFVA